MAERLATIEEFFQEKPESLHPVTRELIASAFREGFLCGVAENFLARMREGVE